MNAKYLMLAIVAVAVCPFVAYAQTDADQGMVSRRAAPPAALSTAPVTAFGVVGSTGTKLSGTPNWSSVYNTASSWYEITIVNESYYFGNYSTEVTPIGLTLSLHPGVYCKTDSVSGKLLVRCLDKNNTPQKSYFGFMVHKYQ